MMLTVKDDLLLIVLHLLLQRELLILSDCLLRLLHR